jgi:RHS repeat-associated protein
VTGETGAAAGDAYKYNGGRLDAKTGLTLFGWRYYDAATGTWTTRDPNGFGGGDYHLYRYVGNDPTDRTDPSGLDDNWDMSAAALGVNGVLLAGVTDALNGKQPTPSVLPFLGVRPEQTQGSFPHLNPVLLDPSGRLTEAGRALTAGEMLPVKAGGPSAVTRLLAAEGQAARSSVDGELYIPPGSESTGSFFNPALAPSLLIPLVKELGPSLVVSLTTSTSDAILGARKEAPEETKYGYRVAKGAPDYLPRHWGGRRPPLPAGGWAAWAKQNYGDTSAAPPPELIFMYQLTETVPDRWRSASSLAVSMYQMMNIPDQFGKTLVELAEDVVPTQELADRLSTSRGREEWRNRLGMNVVSLATMCIPEVKPSVLKETVQLFPEYYIKREATQGLLQRPPTTLRFVPRSQKPPQLVTFEVKLNRAPGSVPGMAKAPGYQLPRNVADFANTNQDRLSKVIGNRMRHVGVPEEMIGIEYYGVDKGPFVRYDPPQLGGNIRVGTNGKPGINVDPAVFDANAPKMGNLPSWKSARVQDRIDAVIAHEYTEVLAPQGVDFHIHALKNAENTPLKISDRARQILKEYRIAEGY